MSEHKEDCSFKGYEGYEEHHAMHHIVHSVHYFHPCDCGYDPRPMSYWKRKRMNWDIHGRENYSARTDWGDWWRCNPCRICHAQTNNNFDLCPGDCMNIYSAWKSLGIVPEHVRIK